MLNDQDWPEEKRTRFLGTILRESERLTTLVERILDFSALDRGSRKVHLRRLSLRELIEETWQAIGPQFESSGLAIECELPDSPLDVWSDAQAVAQALRNLLDNARKYAADGEKIMLSCEVFPQSVRLHVRDFGPGLPRNARHRLFEPFVQGSDTLENKTAGVGLGLALARSWLEAAGGQLTYTPVEGPGACFTLQIPRSPTS
jgi:signal transduction histidine kinase